MKKRFSNSSVKKMLNPMTKTFYKRKRSLIFLSVCLFHNKFSFRNIEKRRNWLIDIHLSLGNSLCDLSTFNEEHSNLLNSAIKTLQKHIDLEDSKLFSFLWKFYLKKKFYGKACKLILKQIDEKSLSQQKDLDNKLLQVNSTFNFSLVISLFVFSLALSIDEYEIFNQLSRTFNHR